MAESEEVQRVTGLVPSSESATSVVGNIDQAGEIAERSLDVVKRFSEAVIHGDIEQAYALCANELRGGMSVARLAAELQSQDAEWGGRPIDYLPQRIIWIYASEKARKRSNRDHDWPKDTPKPNKRAMVDGWWTTEKPPGGRPVGRSVIFWVTEEEDGYRIAKFRPNRP